MRVLIASIQVPFIHGGSELMTNGLRDALLRKGFEAEIVYMPFKFFPESEVERAMRNYLSYDFNSFNGYKIDLMIALQFPAFYAKHENSSLWLMHQHRAVYELYKEKEASRELKELRSKIKEYDDIFLASFKRKYAMSKNVANRALKYNGVETTPLYHPPFNEDKFFCEDDLGYVFFPSRLEELKRQDLLIEAMKYVKTPIKALIAGEGGQRNRYEEMIKKNSLNDKVRLIGRISEEEKRVLYARSLAVVFTPFDEDYGYVTLEAMLSEKPVITCKDSGGVLEFVTDGENGFICENDPKDIAEKLDILYENRDFAKKMGERGFDIYKQKDISWQKVVSALTEEI